MKAWNLKKGCGKAVIVMPLLEASLIRDEELRQNFGSYQVSEWPSCSLPDEEVIAFEQAQQVGYIINSGLCVQPFSGMNADVNACVGQRANDGSPLGGVHDA
jgi:hypothetical protein